MGILEHVKMLEAKVDKEIDFAKKLIEENKALKEEIASQKEEIADLEELLQAYKEEQNAIENGILSVLSQLNQFEDVVEEKRLSSKTENNDDAKNAE